MIQEDGQIKERIQRVTDVALAGVVLTIGLRFPLNTRTELRPPWESLDGIWSYALVFALSVIIIGTVWSNHIRLADTVTRTTRAFLWATVLVLFWVVLFPVVASYLGAHLGEAVPTAAYATVAFGMSLSMNLTRFVAITQDRTNEALAALHASVTYKGLAATLVYAGSIPLAFVSAWASMVCLLVVPVIFVLTETLTRPGRPRTA